jgi:nicotinate-nucleotide adenylyltransferase
MELLSNDTTTTIKKCPLTIGVFGGSFNPIHLGHALLAITVQQTKQVDQVVLVPVYKHAVKTDLLPFADRVKMCQLAVAAFGDDVTVSTIEEDVGESNGAMLRGLKKQYPAGTRFLWICGDDFFRWIDRPKGLETVSEVSGLIVQRRLHRQQDGDGSVFFKEPVDEARVRAVAIKMDLEIDYIYGELPHFSSTLVRRAPGHWRSFLTQTVVQYLDERPHLLKQLIANLEADADAEQNEETKSHALHQRSPSTIQTYGVAAAVVMRGLEAVHALQYERGHAGLSLSTGTRHLEPLRKIQSNTDTLLREILEAAPLDEAELHDFDEVLALAAELKRIPVWLDWDRRVLEKRADELSVLTGPEGWLARLALVEKFNPRIDVLIGATIRALTEILEVSSSNSRSSRTGTTTISSVVDRDIPELLFKWCKGKEALGRLRAFVCAGGPEVPVLVRHSLKLRERLIQTIDTKERSIARVLSLEAGLSSRLSAPDALHKMLENVTAFEYELMGCFASRTKLTLVHKLLGEQRRTSAHGHEFDVHEFFAASSSAIDFLLSFAKALAASACASA